MFHQHLLKLFYQVLTGALWVTKSVHYCCITNYPTLSSLFRKTSFCYVTSFLWVWNVGVASLRSSGLESLERPQSSAIWLGLDSLLPRGLTHMAAWTLNDGTRWCEMGAVDTKWPRNSGGNQGKLYLAGGPCLEPVPMGMAFQPGDMLTQGAEREIIQNVCSETPPKRQNRLEVTDDIREGGFHRSATETKIVT